MSEIILKKEDTEISHDEKKISVSAPKIVIESKSEISRESDKHFRKHE